MQGYRSKTDVDLFGVRFISLWCYGNETGGCLGVRWKDRDIHFTVYERNERINCHITDNDKRIWEKTITMQNLKKMAEKLPKELIRKWKPNERVWPISPEHLETWKDFSFIEGRYNRTEFGEYIKTVAPTLLGLEGGPERLGDSMNNNFYIGFQKRFFQWYLILADPNGKCIRFPLDPKKSPFKKFPTFEGMMRYMKYLDKEGFFDNLALSIDEEAIQRIVGEIEAMIFQSASVINNQKKELSKPG